ncbi:serine hydrolase domain-containing protein [Pseudoalteromonas piscicida]|uniref:Serine hydrolase n=1 Tax=Pseudoalteromonas piscicida TaxID=43662 RepID=A0A2A5JRR1_PSEO7|nr:serine hydrolase domain-containing protein [Pseudoalteromonas piscicida]PCK32105.1 serine hydrolase [Pseudoalteromonas piscicida]
MFVRNYVLVIAKLLLVLVLLLGSACNSNGSKVASAIESKQAKVVKTATSYGKSGDLQLHQQLEFIRREFNVPALGGFIVQGDKLVELDVSGLRISTGTTVVTKLDYWSIGSFTKTMTATLAAKLVEQGLIRFDSRVIDVFSELSGKINPEFESTTLSELLSMTAGLTRDLDSMYTGKWHRDRRSIIAQRYAWTKELLRTHREVPVGTYLYSNAGFVVAGHMLERVSGMSWETLVATEIFTPLGMGKALFGPANKVNAQNQPNGHQMRQGKWHPISPADKVDLPAVVGPAGLVSATLGDLSRYLRAYLAGARGETNLISASSYQQLLTPVTPKYGLGWILSPEHSRFHHNGFTGTFYLDNLILPEKNLAVLAVTNCDTKNAKLAVEKAMEVMLKRFEAR